MKRKYLSALFLACSIGLAGCSTAAVTTSSNGSSEQIAIASAEGVDYSIYDDVLSTYVDDSGWVNYADLQASRQQLDTFNNGLASVDDATLGGWSEEEQIAFWINAYNSLTLKSIIDQTPIKPSIKDITGVWRLRKHPINETEKTLNNIEHDVLRVDFDEPRLHAAIVCAAISCPPLRNEAFNGENLDAQLDEQVVQWLARPDGLKIDKEAGEVKVSKIFSWFGGDWIPSYGVESGFTGSKEEQAVLNFISEYVSEEDRAYLEAGEYKLSYFNYDWSLNDQK
ncbi:putative conserved secreted protein [Leptolyngbya sp. Heron Island J]|uniref:DUF547 domain-containing protein n=1 Tax=Leptolyngbya sp. Heron Island J TaxID=1385935 RepID=UPI0003B9E407|nr:DUF547 domain-containing protein [Leptolyngbya sp. Heron Island J]ESA36787.1 putative conserved secreted protein [Leptolyngbya sp. Heron Island J]